MTEKTKYHSLASVWPFITYFFLLVLYTIFSYSLTAPNLTLSNNPTFWKFQTYMWNTFFMDRKLLVKVYLGLISLLFANYLFILKKLKKTLIPSQLKLKHLILLIAFFILPLVFSNNALSYDVFNYLFNAKMMLYYQADPHIQVAINFHQDDWLRFMHNVHTPAPYARGWTYLSLLPYQLITILANGHKFLPLWFGFRLFSVLSVVLLFLTIRYLVKKINNHELKNLSTNDVVENCKLKIANYLVLFANPLFLIEIISNSHNDLWMMVPAILSMGLVIKDKIQNIKPTGNKKTPASLYPIKVLVSLLLLAASIYIKRASAVLIPIWLLLLIKDSSVFRNILQITDTKFKKIKLKLMIKNWPLLASMLMFVPLFTERSKQFLPWYLVWSMVWLPLIKNKFWKNLILIFSVTAMLRYVPFLWEGAYPDTVLLNQKLIVWVPGAMFTVLHLIKQIRLKDGEE